MREPAVYIDQQLNDFDKFCSSVRHWDLDYRQLEGGQFSSELLMFSSERVLFTRAKLGRRMLQRGSSPEGLVTFGLLAREKSQVFWRNIDITGNQLFIFPPDGELHGVSPSDFDVFVISLPEQKLEEICEAFELPSFKSLIDGNQSFFCDPAFLSDFRIKLLAVSHDLKTHDWQLSIDHYPDEHELAKWLIKLIAGSKPATNMKVPRRRDISLQNAEHFISSADNSLLTIPELCRACNVSERTLEYAFRERYGLTPKAFTLIYRLNEARKQLRASITVKGTVTKVAQDNGFWHMGRFSQQYKKLFGEIPSKTIQIEP